MEIVTTRELLASGYDHAAIRRLVAIGRLQRVRRGAYLRGPGERLVAETRHRLLITALVREHPDAVLSHISAAVLHGLPVPLRTLDRVHLVRRSAHPGSRRLDNSYLHRVTRDVPTTTIDGLLVTDLATTTLDLLRVLRVADAVAVADRALALGQPREELWDRLDSERGRRGNRQAREVLQFADPLAESAGESWTRWAFHCAGLPRPRLQVEFHDHLGLLVARVDFDWADFGLAAEFDGEIKYGRLLRTGQDLAEVIRQEKAREERLRRASGELGDPVALRRTVLEAFRHGERWAG